MQSRKEKIANWWKQENRIRTMIQALLLGLLPVVCCLVYCAAQGKSIGEVYLPGSEWNDELFYYKQVEGIVHGGYPVGYFGFNESHALKLSFAAWSPVLVFPWILWGLFFGWNLMSPVICNIVLMSLCCFLFVWLVKPGWKQVGILTLLFCLYTPFVRYMLSTMPEIICFTMLILFYGMAIRYLKKENRVILALLFLSGSVMTLMRPYLVLFLLLPMYFWTKKRGWKGAAGSVGILAVTLGVYAMIKHYLGAEYFAPLFFTDWVEAFFTQGLFGGLKYTFGKLYYMGKSFWGHTLQGFRTGLASGAFFAGYLVMMLVLLGQSLADWYRIGRLKGLQGQQEKSPESEDRNRRLKNQLVIELHLAFSFVAMLFALLLMYKLTEGSKHLLTFLGAGIFVISVMDTRYFRKAAVLGVTFAYFYSVMAVDPYDYQVPFVQEERQAQVENWRERFAEGILLETEEVPSYENVVIWVFSDEVDGQSKNTLWQMLYALPEGSGISCCMRDYVLENLDSLQSKYLVTVAGGEIDKACGAREYTEIGRDEDTVCYRLH